MNSTGGAPPPPPPPFTFPGMVTPQPRVPPSVVSEAPPPATMASIQKAGMPAALAGAMMKDKKPFTYTPGGLDLSEIKSSRMQRRLQRNASLEGVKPLPQQTSPPIKSPSPLPPQGMIQVLPMPGIGMAASVKSPAKEPPLPKAKRAVCGPAPLPPPFSCGAGGVPQRPEMDKKNPIPTNNTSVLNNTTSHNPEPNANMPPCSIPPPRVPANELLASGSHTKPGAVDDNNAMNSDIPPPPPPPLPTATNKISSLTPQNNLDNFVDTTELENTLNSFSNKADNRENTNILLKQEVLKEDNEHINENNVIDEHAIDSFSEMTDCSSPFYPEEQNSLVNLSDQSQDIASSDADHSALEIIPDNQKQSNNRWISDKVIQLDIRNDGQPEKTNQVLVNYDNGAMTNSHNYQKSHLITNNCDNQENHLMKIHDNQENHLTNNIRDNQENNSVKNTNNNQKSNVDLRMANSAPFQDDQENNIGMRDVKPVVVPDAIGAFAEVATEQQPVYGERVVERLYSNEGANQNMLLNSHTNDTPGRNDTFSRQSSLPANSTPSIPQENNGDSGRINLKSNAPPNFVSHQNSQEKHSLEMDKPLPWMVGIRKEEPPGPDFVPRATKVSQPLQRQNSLPQNAEVNYQSAPWRQPHQRSPRPPVRNRSISPESMHLSSNGQLPPQNLAPLNGGYRIIPNQSQYATLPSRYRSKDQEVHFQQNSTIQHNTVINQCQQRERIIPITLETSPPETPQANNFEAFQLSSQRYNPAVQFNNQNPPSCNSHTDYPYPSGHNSSTNTFSACNPPPPASVPYSINATEALHQIQNNLNQLNNGLRNEEPYSQNRPQGHEGVKVVVTNDVPALQSKSFNTIQMAYGAPSSTGYDQNASSS